MKGSEAAMDITTSAVPDSDNLFSARFPELVFSARPSKLNWRTTLHPIPIIRNSAFRMPRAQISYFITARGFAHGCGKSHFLTTLQNLSKTEVLRQTGLNTNPLGWKHSAIRHGTMCRDVRSHVSSRCPKAFALGSHTSPSAYGLRGATRKIKKQRPLRRSRLYKRRPHRRKKKHRQALWLRRLVAVNCTPPPGDTLSTSPKNSPDLGWHPATSRLSRYLRDGVVVLEQGAASATSFEAP